MDEDEEQELTPSYDPEQQDFIPDQIIRRTRNSNELTESKVALISLTELKLRGAIFSNFITRDSIGDMFSA
jgi:hypothetical protein